MFTHTDREADGAGAFGVAQHTQEAGVLSAGSTGHRHGEETCKKHALNQSRGGKNLILPSRRVSNMLQRQGLCVKLFREMLVLHVAHTEIKRGSITVIPLSVLARTCYLVL